MGKKSYTRWLFVLPAIVIVIALFIYPICSSIVYSFTNKNLIKPAYKFIGFKNYAEVLRDSGFWLSFFNSLKWTVLSLVGQIAVGFTAALRSKIGALLVKPALKETLKSFDGSQYGGAPLLGLKGLVVKTHGNSKRTEVRNSIIQCVTFKEQDINGKIQQCLNVQNEE